MSRLTGALAALALTFATAPSAIAQDASAPSQEVAPSAEARVVAAIVYADWCGSCRVLDPKVQAAEAARTDDAARFVRLDFTNRNVEAWLAQADAAGIGEAARAHLAGNRNKVKTGRLLVIDASTGSIAEELGRSVDPADINAAIDQIVATSASTDTPA